MNKKLALVLGLCISTSSPLFALDASSWKLGSGFGGDSSTVTATVDIVTPTFASFSLPESAQKLRLAVFTRVDVRFPFNNSVYGYATPAVSLGLRGTRSVPDSNLDFYAVLAADLAFVHPSASTSTLNWGMLATFGCDFLIEKGRKDILLGIHNETFFVEGNLLLHEALNGLTSNQYLLTGFFPRIGMRANF